MSMKTQAWELPGQSQPQGFLGLAQTLVVQIQGLSSMETTTVTALFLAASAIQDGNPIVVRTQHGVVVFEQKDGKAQATGEFKTALSAMMLCMHQERERAMQAFQGQAPESVHSPAPSESPAEAAGPSA